MWLILKHLKCHDASRSLVIGVAVGAITVAIVGLHKVIFHEVDGEVGVGLNLSLLVLHLLLLYEGLFFLGSLIGGFGLGLDGVLVGHGVIEFGGVYSVVILEVVVDHVSGSHGILFVRVDLLKLASGHLLGGLNTLEGRAHVLVVVQAGASKDGLILFCRSANHVGNINLVEIT